MNHDEILACVKKIYNLKGKQLEVNGFIDTANPPCTAAELELSNKPEKFIWAFTKLRKINSKRKILFVKPEHLRKAERYRKSYGFDEIEIQKIPEECLAPEKS